MNQLSGIIEPLVVDALLKVLIYDNDEGNVLLDAGFRHTDAISGCV